MFTEGVSTKREKGRILDEFCALTGYNRSYAAGVLRKGPPAKGKRAPLRPVGSRRGRKPVYTAEVRKYLVKVWAILDCPCGKRLVAAMPHTGGPGEVRGDQARRRGEGEAAFGERLHL